MDSNIVNTQHKSDQVKVELQQPEESPERHGHQPRECAVWAGHNKTEARDSA
jgi:hypothetical protein